VGIGVWLLGGRRDDPLPSKHLFTGSVCHEVLVEPWHGFVVAHSREA
jgi:hypothetical protein